MIPMNPGYMLYYVPVLVAVSLVLSATRNEDRGAILRQWVYNMVWITVFMAVVALVLQIALWWVER